MRVLMVAPPGAGKGTQGAVIAAHFDIPHIATGDLLRDHVARRTALGLAVQEHLDRGELVPDEIVLDMVRAEMTTARERGGYVLDGIPRSLVQARALYQIGLSLNMTADVALHLKADDDELIRRLLARAALERRSDDTEDVIRHRLELYHTVTFPIVDWYAARGILVSVDAMRPADRVGRQILTALEAMRPLLEYVPEHARRPIDLTGLGAAFGETNGNGDSEADRIGGRKTKHNSDSKTNRNGDTETKHNSDSKTNRNSDTETKHNSDSETNGNSDSTSASRSDGAIEGTV
jgi:adenylate kinase